jgi:hypothetical protein|tara:strand:- start:4 stop:423 length:420 start_codon:yes stop_codon:yes gene_type:complete
MTEKYLYFRSDATLANDDDASGSILYPVSSLKGMCSGTAAATGVITTGDSVLHLAFQPQAIPTGVVGEDQGAAGDGDSCDFINITITTANNQKAVMKSIVKAIKSSGDDGFIEVFDANSGLKVDPDITSISVIKTDYAD